jgi:hypothetical protein
MRPNKKLMFRRRMQIDPPMVTRRKADVMPINSITLSVIMIVATFVAAAYAEDKGAAKQRLVEYIYSGDDIRVDRQIAAEVKNALKQSSDFTLSGGQKPGTLIIFSPKGANEKLVNKRCKDFYVVEFLLVDSPEWDLFDSPNKIGEGKGSCRCDDPKTCALQIVRDARKTVRKIK